MSVLWERLYGDTSHFAIKLSFREDPDKGCATTPDYAKSWGSFELWVGGNNICAHNEDGQFISAVHWHLAPFLLWLAKNWNYLLHEEKMPLKNDRDNGISLLESSQFPPLGLTDEKMFRWESIWQTWWLRHCLQASREGGLFPDVSIRRWRHLIEISWQPSTIAGVPKDYQFIAHSGCERLDPDHVARPLYDALRDASSYLLERSPASPTFTSLKRLIGAIGSKRDHSIRLALLAGLGDELDPILRHWKKINSRIKKAGSRVADALLGKTEDPLVITGSCQAALMFGSVSPKIAHADVVALAGRLISLYHSAGDPPPLRKVMRDDLVSSRLEYPWKQGYQLAEEAAEKLPRCEREGAIDVNGTAKHLGIEIDEIALEDNEIRAISIAGPRHKPSILLNTSHGFNRSPNGRRFSLAHELCHILHDRAYGRILALASGPWAPRGVERRANAFAAMFLMPSDLISEHIKSLASGLATLEGIIELSGKLQTSPHATLEHLTNLGYLAEPERDRMRSELESRVSGA